MFGEKKIKITITHVNHAGFFEKLKKKKFKKKK
jgi:hypothetical protein